jgi:hypothetical protein
MRRRRRIHVCHMRKRRRIHVCHMMQGAQATCHSLHAGSKEEEVLVNDASLVRQRHK